MNRLVLSACVVFALGCASAWPADSATQQGTAATIPRAMQGTWILADTGQCAVETGKIVVTADAVQFGKARSDRLRFIPKSGAYGGDALHFRMFMKDDVLEYEAANDRLIWQSKGTGTFTVEYFERCAW